MAAPALTSEQQFEKNVRIERGLNHWIRRIVFDCFNSEFMDSREVAIGGGITLDYYLEGSCLNSWHMSKNMFMPVSIHYDPGARTPKSLGRAIMEYMNKATYFGSSRSSAIYMMANTLKKNEIKVDVHKVETWVPMIYDSTKKLGDCVMMDLKHFDPSVGNIAVVRIIELSTRDANMLRNSDALIMHPTIAMYMMPIGHLIQNTVLCNNEARKFIMRAIVNGHTVLHDTASTGDDALKPYHFAMKTCRTILAKNDHLADSLGLSDSAAKSAILSYKQSKSTTLVETMLERAVSTIDSASRNGVEVRKPGDKKPLKSAPGRYANERIWLEHVLTKENPDFLKKHGIEKARDKDLIWLYSAESSRYNVACLISGVLRELTNVFMQQKFSLYQQKYAGTFAEYDRDLMTLFENLTKLKSRYDLVSSSKKSFKDMYVFRAVDLFDIGNSATRNVYNTRLPFEIVNNTMCSTSIDLDIAWNGFLKPSPCCLLRVRIPNDYSAFLVIQSVSEYPDEREVLLPGKSIFTVHTRKYLRDDNGRQVLLLDADVSWPHMVGGKAGSRRNSSITTGLSQLSQSNGLPQFVDISSALNDVPECAKCSPAEKKNSEKSTMKGKQVRNSKKRHALLTTLSKRQLGMPIAGSDLRPLTSGRS
jgi:hypothetical protein